MMKSIKHFLLLTLILCASIVSAQTTETTRNLGAFNLLDVGNGIKVELVKGDKETIKIIARGIETEKVRTEINNRLLKIDLKPGVFKNIEVKVILTYKDIYEITASSSAEVKATDVISGDDIRFKVSSSAYLEAEVDAEFINLEAASSGKMFIKGSSNSQLSKAMSNGEINALELSSDVVNVTANSAGKATVQANKELSASAATAGKVIYKGSAAKKDVKSTTGGSVTQN